MLPADWTPHRRDDGELLGWIRPEGEDWVAVDLLGREASGAVDWLEAEAALEANGLSWLADVWVLETSVDRMRDLEIALDGRVTLAMSNRLQVEEVLPDADLVIGAVLVPGARAPKLVTRDMLALMRPQAVLVDVAIDQGGCFETSHATTHDDPVFEVDGIVHYCVTNMPGAVGRTSTYALTNVTLPYARKIARLGFPAFAQEDDALARGGRERASAPRLTAPARRQAHARSERS